MSNHIAVRPNRYNSPSAYALYGPVCWTSFLIGLQKPPENQAFSQLRVDDEQREKSPHRRFKKRPARIIKLQVGWCKFKNFPSSMGRKINPGGTAHSKHHGLSVAVIGPNHASREGQCRVVRTVKGKPTAVILRDLRETHPKLPISFYRWSYANKGERSRRLRRELLQS